MPNYIAGPAMDFQAQIARLERMVKAIASQQNLVISNNQREKVLTLGVAASLPASTYTAPDSSNAPTFALQLLNPNGTPMMQVGEQFDSAYSPGMVFFSANGDPLVILDDAGLTVKDSGGNTRVQVGELPNGDYGLQVTDTAGTTRAVNPLYSVDGPTSTTVAPSTSYATFGFPTLTVPIGASGTALVMAGALLGPDGGTLEIGISINGAAPTYPFAGMQTNQGSAMAQAVFTGLPTGNVDFSLRYVTISAAGDGVIDYPVLTVWPL